MKKKVLKYLIRALLIYIIYLAAGALLPFARMSSVDEQTASSFNMEDYLGTETGVDRAAVVETNQDALDSRLSMIYNAKEKIIISTFDIRDGHSTRDLFSVLYEAAERGVDIKILVDGCSGMFHMKSEPLYYALGSHENIEFRFYNQPNFLKPWTLNGRMHDKYIIVDDIVMLMGGRNMYDYFIGEHEDHIPGYDREVLIYNTATGTPQTSDSVLSDTEAYFSAIWNLSVCKTVYDKPSKSKAKAADKEVESLRERYTTIMKDKPNLFEPLDYESTTIATEKVTLIYNPTHIYSKQPTLWYQLYRIMLQADERAVFQTPYAVLSKEMYAQTKEISETIPNFTLLLNSRAVGDNIVASSDYTINRKNILKTGVTLKEFFGDYSSHSKSLLIDDNISIIGSYNMDMRSTYIDTESMLVIHSQAFNGELSSYMEVFDDLSLTVNPDGTYQPKEGVEVKSLPGIKKYLYPISSWFIQLVRFLA